MPNYTFPDPILPFIGRNSLAYFRRPKLNPRKLKNYDAEKRVCVDTQSALDPNDAELLAGPLNERTNLTVAAVARPLDLNENQLREVDENLSHRDEQQEALALANEPSQVGEK